MSWKAVIAVVLSGGLLSCGVADEGVGVESTASRSAVEEVDDDSVAAATPARADGRRRTLVLFEGLERDVVLAAVRRQGGRLLVSFDEPAAIVLLSDSGAQVLRREQELSLLTGAAEEPAQLAAAPMATGAWNRMLGVSVEAPAPARAPGQLAPPRRGRVERPRLGEPLQMSAADDGAARRTLRRFMSCVAQAPEQRAGCLDELVAASARGALQAQLEREGAVAQERQVDPSRYEFRLDGWDGRLARYEIRLEGHPTGAIYVTAGGEGSEAWTVTFVDP